MLFQTVNGSVDNLDMPPINLVPIHPKLDVGRRIARKQGKDLEDKPKRWRDKDAYNLLFYYFISGMSSKNLAKTTSSPPTEVEIMCAGVKLSNDLVNLQQKPSINYVLTLSSLKSPC